MTLEILLAIGGVVLALIAVLQTQRANKFAERVAIAEGSLDAPSLEFSAFGKTDIDLLLVAVPLTTKRIIEMPLPCLVTNTGAKTVRELDLLISRPKPLCFGGAELTFTAPVKLRGQQMPSSGERQNILLQCDTLHPGQAASFDIPLSLAHETSLRSPVNATTKDGVGVSFSLQVHYGFRMDFICTQADQKPNLYTIDLVVIDTATDGLWNALGRRYKFIESGARLKSKKKPKRLMVLDIQKDQLRPDAVLP